MLLNLTEWIVSSLCALHDAHNALKWSMHHFFSDKELMTDLHNVIESLRKLVWAIARVHRELACSSRTARA